MVVHVVSTHATRAGKQRDNEVIPTFVMSYLCYATRYIGYAQQGSKLC